MKKFVLCLIAIVLIVAAGIGGWFLGKSQKNGEKVEISKAKTYDDIKGTYESQEVNLNAGTNIDAHNVNYTLILSREGTFAAYYLNGDTDCHYVGYYTINDKKITLNSVVLTGNDPSAGLSTDVMEFTLNDDGTLVDKDNIKFTRKSETPREETNIAKVINEYLAGVSTSGKTGMGPWFFGLSE